MSDISQSRCELRPPTILLHPSDLDSDSERETETPSYTRANGCYRDSDSNFLGVEALAVGRLEKRPCSCNDQLASPNSSGIMARVLYKGKIKTPAQENGTRPRSSRFLEGSMNDRVSQMPPLNYIGPEDELLKYERAHKNDSRRSQSCQSTRRSNPSPHRSTTASSMPGSSETRGSSIFRLGRSIAATFNLANWKKRPTSHESQDDEKIAQNRLLNERQEKATKLYQELKNSGQFRNIAIRPEFRQNQSEKPAAPSHSEKHDSAVALNDSMVGLSRTKRERCCVSLDGSRLEDEETRRGKVFLESSTISPDKTPLLNFIEPVTAQSTSPYPRKSIEQLKTPLLSNIRKVFTCAPSLSDRGDHVPWKVPSRKDLRKQQRLVKRVSDLEIKLEVARRQLTEVTGVADLTFCKDSARESPRFHSSPSLVPESRSVKYTSPENEEREIENQIKSEMSRIVSPNSNAPNFSSKLNLNKSRTNMISPVCVDKKLPPEPTCIEGQSGSFEKDSSSAACNASKTEPTIAQVPFDHGDVDGKRQKNLLSTRHNLTQNPSRKKRKNDQAADYAKKVKISLAPIPKETLSPSPPIPTSARIQTNSTLSEKNPDSCEPKLDTKASESSLVSSLGDVLAEFPSVATSSKPEPPPRPARTSHSTTHMQKPGASNNRAKKAPRRAGLNRGRGDFTPPAISGHLDSSGSNNSEISSLPHPKQEKKSLPSPPRPAFVRWDRVEPKNSLENNEPHDQGYDSCDSEEVDLDVVPPLPNLPQAIIRNGELVITEKQKVAPISTQKSELIKSHPTRGGRARVRDEKLSKGDGAHDFYEWPEDVF